MALETYDWSGGYSDEQGGTTTTFTSGTGDTVDITVSQPDPNSSYMRHGDGYESQIQGGGLFRPFPDGGQPSQQHGYGVDHH